MHSYTGQFIVSIGKIFHPLGAETRIYDGDIYVFSDFAVYSAAFLPTTSHYEHSKTQHTR